MIYIYIYIYIYELGNIAFLTKTRKQLEFRSYLRDNHEFFCHVLIVYLKVSILSFANFQNQKRSSTQKVVDVLHKTEER